MDKTAIYDALHPDWWVKQQNTWNTEFVSTEVIYNTAALTGCVYTSSAPIQTNGLNAGTDAPSTELADYINILRLEAAQRLYDSHATAITGHQKLGSVYNATA